MREDDFRELLLSADEQFAPALPPAHVVVQRVRQLDRRAERRRKALAAVSACAILISAGVAWRMWHLDNAGPEQRARQIATIDSRALAQLATKADAAPSVNVDTASTADELERLAAMADASQRIARRMIADRAALDLASRRQREHAQPDPMEEVRERLDTVAFRLICEADGLRAEMRPDEEALTIYRRVIRLFPDTRSAHIARERISALGQS